MLLDVLGNVLRIRNAARQDYAVYLAAYCGSELGDILRNVEAHSFINDLSIAVSVRYHLLYLYGVSRSEVSDESALAVEELHGFLI